MTARQSEIWALYVSGHGPAAIAQALGMKSRGAVSYTIKQIKREIQNPVERYRASVPCPYSPSCFSCPLHDCAIDPARAARVNVLPGDIQKGVIIHG